MGREDEAEATVRGQAEVEGRRDTSRLCLERETDRGGGKGALGRQTRGVEREPMLAGSKGVILAKVRINRDGSVDSVEIVRSTMPLLDDVVRKHILGSWKFEPTILAGKPVAVEFLQPFSFIF